MYFFNISILRSTTWRSGAWYLEERVFFLRRCFLFQRSDELIEQQRCGHDFKNTIFMRNILFPESIVSEATASNMPVSSVFFPQPQKCQVAICQEHQENMPVPSSPWSPPMVIFAEFFFELLITVLYPVSFMVETSKINCRQILLSGLARKCMKNPGIKMFGQKGVSEVAHSDTPM